jgi:drug/metabolite transporter (DMT)-like permease
VALWIPITLVAAFLQNIRSGLQKHLKSAMGTTGATFVRFGFGAPFVMALLLALHLSGQDLPALNAPFLAWAVTGALAQITATFLLVHLFAFRNFAVGTAYSRTEPAMAAVLGLLLLHENLSPGGWIAVAICMAGVMVISLARTSFSVAALATALSERSSLIGLASGLLFGLSAVSYRGASLVLGGPNFFVQAAVTLAFVIGLQTALLVVWMLLREPAQFALFRRAWRRSLATGLAGAAASLGWFTAMTLQNAALVKALAQVEMLFAIATSVFLFRETINRREVIGCLLIVAGVVSMALFKVWRG